MKPIEVDSLYVNSVRGNDSAPGTLALPLRTLAGLEERVRGRFIAPKSGIFTINLTGDFTDQLLTLPAEGLDVRARVFIRGTPVVVASGILTSVTAADMSTNTPLVVGAGSAFDWTNHSRTFLRIDSGPVRGCLAPIVGDMNGLLELEAGETALQGFWTPDNGVFSEPPESLPGPGAKFSVLSLPTIVLGRTPFPVRCIFLTIVGGYEYAPVMDANYVHCIIGAPFRAFSRGEVINFNCIFTHGGEVCSQHWELDGCLFMPVEGVDYPGGIRVTGGCEVSFSGSPMFVAGPDQPADLQVSCSRLTGGPLSFWGCYHGLNLGEGATLAQRDIEEPALWGKGNRQLYYGTRATHLIDGRGIATLPTIECTESSPILFANFDLAAAADSGSAVAFNKSASPPAFTAPIAFTWAALNVDVPTGFRTSNYDVDEEEGTYTITSANAQAPAGQTLLSFSTTTFTPAEP